MHDTTTSEIASVAAVGGNRLRWHEIPQRVRASVESGLGGAVVAAENRPGGFSPGLASVLTLADGRTVFAKSVSMSRNTFTVGAIRREVEVLVALPEGVPAPKLLWSYDDGEWVALVTEAIDGHNPVQPWRRDELDRFLAAATVLAETLTPAPMEAAAIWDEPTFRSWSGLAASADRLAPWIRARVGDLAALDQHWPTATRGESLMHGDFRADNIVLTPDGGFVAVDWPSVLLGPPWLDLLCTLPSVAMHGGGDPESLWAGHPFARSVAGEVVDVVLAGFAGFMLHRSLQPVDPLLPTVREFQRSQGEIALRWLSGRRAWS